MATFQVYESKDGKYRWRLKAGNGQIVAASQGYTRRESAHVSVQDIKTLAPIADTEDI